ncbi:HEAT repeat domain-containing protein [Streptomyces fructofermentans]|uniref:HEAT repeat domain-containing protein n=1 Tax=Streptomyces fructofermentans TaxID=152141 RepID=UPI0034051B55
MNNVSMQDVRRVLDPEEPNYAAMARLGTESLPHLRALVQSDDPMLAAKSAYAASLLEGDQGQDVILVAAQSDDPVLRVAAASAAVNLPAASAADVLVGLAADGDAGVRKVALSSVPPDVSDEIVGRLRDAAAEAGGAP